MKGARKGGLGWKKEKGRGEREREREPLIISFTTLFRPLLR